MKNSFSKLTLAALAFTLSINTLTAQEAYKFNHGPYLQGLTNNQVKVFFTTSAKGFSWVELREKGSDVSERFVTVNEGLIEANNTHNAIGIEGLKPATAYEYRLVSKEIPNFQPYKVTYGDSITTPWYGFSTLDPKAKEFSFVAMSDIHDDSEKYRKLMSHMPMDSATMVFLVGDMMSYFNNMEQPYKSFIDASVDVYAKQKPFVIVRGNHETRGHLARFYKDFVYLPGGHYYGLYRIGNTAIVMLDSGEDKPDTHSVYAGIVAFDGYRRQQADWLKQIVKSNEFRSAQHRIVMVHIPPIDRRNDERRARETDHGAQQVYDLYMPILNKEKIDIMISGHTHRQMLFEVTKGKYNFPVIVNDNKSASFVTVTDKGVRVRTVDTEGKVTLDRTF